MPTVRPHGAGFSTFGTKDMAADIVNLRQFRKTKARAEREATADQTV